MCLHYHEGRRVAGHSIGLSPLEISTEFMLPNVTIASMVGSIVLTAAEVTLSVFQTWKMPLALNGGCHAGPRSSALIGGFTTTHRELECALAALKGTEDCLLFPSGYAANTATLATLANGPDCAIFSDALNHASIIDGCRLAARSGAHLKVYRHCDLQHLERHLQGSQHRRKLVVTDSLFSMDGETLSLTLSLDDEFEL